MAEGTANTVVLGDRTYHLDAFGYLDPPEQWDEAFAEGMAPVLGIFDGLREDHWRLINYLRKRFIEERVVPVVVFACRDNKLTLARLRHLFPTGYHRGACKLAGINYAFMSEHNLLLTYENYRPLKAEHPLTEDGFLAHFDRWSRLFGQLVAMDWELAGGVTDKHWEVVAYLRDCYRVRRAVPTLQETCRAMRLDLGCFHRLFPDGYRRGACRMAGLPFLY